MAKVKSSNYGEQEAIRFSCPGCQHSHIVTINGKKNNCGATWGFNGDFDNPTITPSILSRYEWDDCSALTDADYGPWVPCKGVEGARERTVKPEAKHKVIPHRDICHSFVKKGMIQFLGDCTHALAGQTVPLADV